MLIVIFSCCKKEKDTITYHNIKGMVYNNCTDSGLVNVAVNLNTYKDNSLTKTLAGTSVAGGNFEFPNVEIHSDSKYSYSIYIPSKSGINATTAEYCGFNGATMYFSKDEADLFLSPRVTPKFLLLNVSHIYSSPITNLNDSIIVLFSQRVFHKNLPTLPYVFGGETYGNVGNSKYSSGNYPMGKYNINIDKWKGGVHTTILDSIYLGWTETKTYTVNW